MALLALSACTAGAQEQIGQVSDAAGTIKVTVESLFDGIPPHGFLPARVSIENGSGAAVSLLFETSSKDNQYWQGENSAGGTFRLGAEAGQDAMHEILIPLVPSHSRGGGYYGGAGGSVTVRVSGGGLPEHPLGTHSDLMGHLPCVALSTESHRLGWDVVKGELETRAGVSPPGSSGSGTFGARFDPARLPANWRGLSGFDAIVFRDDEWGKVVPTARVAVLDWVRMGGRLVLWVRDGSVPNPSELGIEGLQGESLGLGSVIGVAGTGAANTNPIGAEQLVGPGNRARGFIHAVSNDFDGGQWPLRGMLGTRTFNSAQVIVILVVFAVIVGPVNLFLLAKSGRRHRLFVTTPIISIAASLLIAALIFIQDGFGGKGVRSSLTFIDPGARKSYTVQEQLARSGVLLGRSFEVEEPLVLTPVAMGQSRWTFVNRDRGGTGLGFALADKTYSGDWFRSRSEQGHLAQRVVQTRESVQVLAAELGPEGQPVVLSTLAFPLARLAYFDAKGVVWTGENVATGEKTTLSKWDPGEFRKWWHLGLASLGGRFLIEAAGGAFESAPAGHFYAVASEGGKPPTIETLDSIKWSNAQALVFGITETIGKGGPPAP